MKIIIFQRLAVAVIVVAAHLALLVAGALTGPAPELAAVIP